MTSRWIAEIAAENEFVTDRQWNKVLVVVERINKLLREACFSVDNEDLYERILKEIEETE